MYVCEGLYLTVVGQSSDGCILVRSKNSLHGLLQNVASSEPSIAWCRIQIHMNTHTHIAAVKWYVQQYCESIVDPIDHTHIQVETLTRCSHGHFNFLYCQTFWDYVYRSVLWRLWDDNGVAGHNHSHIHSHTQHILVDPEKNQSLQTRNSLL